MQSKRSLILIGLGLILIGYQLGQASKTATPVKEPAVVEEGLKELPTEKPKEELVDEQKASDTSNIPRWTEADEQKLQSSTHPEEGTAEFSENRTTSNEDSTRTSDGNPSNSIGQSTELTQQLTPRASQYQPSKPRNTYRGGGYGLYAGEGDGHWIESNHDGEIIRLEDGSTWKVDSGDEAECSTWVPVTNITVTSSSSSDYLLINTDDNEHVGASLLTQ
jgi:hypothetical protein